MSEPPHSSESEELPAAVAETHTGIVFFAGNRAYKLKKPVKFDFLDFSTPEKRRDALTQELQLNRRISPEVYLDLVELVGSDEKAIEYMLLMKRLPRERSLEVLAVSGEELSDCILAIARKLAKFHSAAITSDEVSSVATQPALTANWLANLSETARFAPQLLDGNALEHVRSLALRYISGRAALFDDRIVRGCIRDGHGDLLAADIFCMQDSPVILDCIEFDDRLRWGDVISDIAFLAMDLERLDRQDLAEMLFARYHEFSGETAPESLKDHYIALRALIRSKVASIRWMQGDADSGETACKLLKICEEHLVRARVRLVLVGGTPGTGKSTLAAALSERLGWPALRSDIVRKQLAGMSPDESGKASFGEGIYTAEWNRKTYSSLLAQSRKLLEMGESVILDASWARIDDRLQARRLGAEVAAEVLELVCQCTPEIAMARIRERQTSGRDPSDADVEVAKEMRFDEWPEAIRIDTSDTLASSLEIATGSVS